MARLRNAMMAVVLGTGVMGCSFAHWSPFHCDECDNFPAPSYGPDFSMMPGSYTGLPPSNSDGTPRTEAAAAPSGPGTQPAAGGLPALPVEEAPPPSPSPPVPPTAAPRTSSARAISPRTPYLARANAGFGDPALPPLPDLPPDDSAARADNR
jgi:hypothetical protein